EWGTHLDKIKNRNTGDLFFLGWGPALYGQGTIQPLFLADQTYSSYGNNKVIDEKIARVITITDARGRAAAYAELQKLIHDEAPWGFLWQQHDLYGVANTVEGTARADEKVWMYDAKIVARQRHGERSVMSLTVFTNALLIDCTGGEPVEGAAVVVEDDRIKDVIRHGNVGALPGPVTTLDCKGAALMPGPTDAHVHICPLTANTTDPHRLPPARHIAPPAPR